MSMLKSKFLTSVSYIFSFSNAAVKKQKYKIQMIKNSDFTVNV